MWLCPFGSLAKNPTREHRVDSEPNIMPRPYSDIAIRSDVNARDSGSGWFAIRRRTGTGWNPGLEAPRRARRTDACSLTRFAANYCSWSGIRSAQPCSANRPMPPESTGGLLSKPPKGARHSILLGLAEGRRPTTHVKFFAPKRQRRKDLVSEAG